MNIIRKHYLEAFGSSTLTVHKKKGFGVDIILKSPFGDTIEQFIKREFPSSNNEAKCEVVLAGLKIEC